jgi:hypothetical protein
LRLDSRDEAFYFGIRNTTFAQPLPLRPVRSLEDPT